MALIKCSECGKEISDKADICPHCGYPINNIRNKNNLINKKKKYVIGLIFLVTIFIVGILILLLTTKSLRQYQKAKVAYENKNYTVAREIFQNLGDYKDSEEMYLKSEEMYQISNDKTPPVISGIPQNLVVKVGQEFDIETWICEQGVSAYDNISGTTDIVVDKSGFDINVPGTYEIELSTQDEAGNLEKELISIVVKDYPTHEAYLQAVNISESNISITATGSGEYEGIHISQDEIGRLEDGSVYRSIAKQLEGFYVLGEDFYGNWGNDIPELIWGIEKPKEWEDLQERVDDTMAFISRRQPLGEILNRLQETSCTEGDFDYINGKFSFIITDLTKAAEELGITEKMLGYILAMLEEYAPDTAFSGNTYSLQLSVVGQKEDKSVLSREDFISYTNIDQECDVLTYMNERNYNFQYYFYDKHNAIAELNEWQNDSYADVTHRGVSLLGSYNSLMFKYGQGDERTFEKNGDVLYSELIAIQDSSAKVLDTCTKYVIYRYEDRGEIIFYLDDSDDIVYILYTNVIIY